MTKQEFLEKIGALNGASEELLNSMLEYMTFDEPKPKQEAVTTSERIDPIIEIISDLLYEWRHSIVIDVSYHLQRDGKVEIDDFSFNDEIIKNIIKTILVSKCIIENE